MAWDTPADVDRFPEAIAWFDSKAPITQEEYDRLDAATKSRAFTIAAQVELEVVQTVFDEMSRAIKKGLSYEDFAESTVEKIGSLPLPGHVLETTFINNTQQSYNAGRWYQITDPDVVQLRPYLMYDSVLDSRTTPHCKEWDGVIRPAGDMVWLMHSPQCHHRCRAGLRSLRERDVERRGGTTLAIPGEAASSGFGLAPPLQMAPEPNRERIDDDVWNVFVERLGRAKSQVND